MAKNLAGLNKIAPVIGDYLNDMVENMNGQFGIELDTTKLMDTEFSQLPNYLGETFRVTPLGSMLRATSGTDTLDPLLMEICYGEEGIDYILGDDGEPIMQNGAKAATFETLGANTSSLINKVTLASVVSIPTDDAVMLALAYGKKDITWEFKKDEEGNFVKDENGQYIPDMKPMYFEVDGTNVFDYDGNPVAGTIAVGEDGEYALTDGYIVFTKAPTFEGGTAVTYYLKDDGTGKYFAYKQTTDPENKYQAVDFKKTVIGDIQDSSIIDNIYLGDALGVTVDKDGNINQHKIIVDLAYGTEGVDWKIGTLETGELGIKMIGDAKPRTIGELKERNTDLINEIQIADIMSASHDDKVVMYLLYGKEDIHYTIDENDKPIMLQKRILVKTDSENNQLLAVCNEYGEKYIMKSETLPGCELIQTPGTYTRPDSTTLNYNGTFKDIAGTAYYYVEKESEIDEETGIKTTVYLLHDQNGKPVEYRHHTLGDLSGNDNLVSRMTDRLTVMEVLGAKDVAQNKFLKHIGNCTIGGMADAVLNLTVGEIFETDIYVAKNGSTDTHEGLADGVYKYTGDEAFTAAIKGEDGATTTVYKGEFFEVAGGTKYAYTPQESDIAPTWKYLLKDKTTGHINTNYKVSTDMNALLENMTHNVHISPLDELSADGIIDFGEDAETLLNTTVRASVGTESVTLPTGVTEGTRLGALTTTQMLAYTSQLLQAVNTVFPPTTP